MKKKKPECSEAEQRRKFNDSKGKKNPRRNILHRLEAGKVHK